MGGTSVPNQKGGKGPGKGGASNAGGKSKSKGSGNAQGAGKASTPSSSGKTGKGSGKGPCTTQRNGGKAGSSQSFYNADGKRFLQQLRSTKPESLEKVISSAPELWQQCWADAETFSFESLHDLSVVLAKIPFSATVPPPPVIGLKSAMKKYVEKSSSDATDALQVVEVILNVIKKLLQFRWEDEQEVVKDALLDILEGASGKLQRRNRDHRDALSRLDAQMDDLEKPWTIKLKASAADFDAKGTRQDPADDDAAGANDSNVPRLHHSKWRDATVEWLCHSELFVPSHLPKMQGPSTKSKGVYASSEHYFDTTQRLMVGMAFCEGHGALSPRCWEKDCGNTLWPLASDGTSEHLRCRTRDCRNPPVLACKMRFHNSGLCGRCAEKEKVKLLGVAGPQASTHVYDGRVRKIDVAGRIYIEQFESRKPPTEREIHWKTTKRLACPNLVGIVKVGTSGTTGGGKPKGRALRVTDSILWGELANHAAPKDEFQNRKAGQLCVNMSSITGGFDPESFSEGDIVAIIDCMTFVPEYIPVLRALEQQALQGIPFDDGALLNLNAERPASMLNTVFAEASENDLFRGQSGSAALPRSTIERLVEEMIQCSSLQPIKEIRQNSYYSSQLKTELVNLIEQTTLDKGQLVNFVDGLRNSVHLTQGPPGTGKSYLGVVLVRALMRVRSLWMQQNPSVGQPPILVLSYKNHATDEFLLDLLKAEPKQLGGSASSWRGGNWRGGPELVRIGNPGDPNLTAYAEKNLALRGDARLKQCKQDLEDIHNLRKACQAVCKAALLFAGFQGDMFDSGQDAHLGTQDNKKSKKQNYAAYEATEVLLASLVRARLLETKFRKRKAGIDALPPSDDDASDDDDSDSSSNVDVDQCLQQVASFMTLDSADDHRCRKLQASLSNEDIAQEVPLLHDGLSHYMELDPRYDDMHEVLFMFLKGLRPLPRCNFSHVDRYGYSTQCRYLADSHEAPYCSAHRCNLDVTLATGVKQRCCNAIDQWKKYICRRHGCAWDECSNPRYRVGEETQENFCKIHVCFKCVELGCHPAQAAQDDPPRNVCWEHQLCCFTECRELAIKGEDYCVQHTWTPCQFRGFFGRQCKMQAICRELPFCEKHAGEAAMKARQNASRLSTSVDPDDDDAEDPELVAAVKRNSENRTCAGKNRKGKPCGGRAMPNSDFCDVHAPRQEFYKVQPQPSQEEKPDKQQGDKQSEHDSAKAATPLESSQREHAPSTNADSVGLNAGDVNGTQQRADDFEDAKSEASETFFGPPPGFDDADRVDGGMYDNIDEVDEADGAQHIREIFEIQEGNDVDQTGDESDEEDYVLNVNGQDPNASAGHAASSAFFFPGSHQHDEGKNGASATRRVPKLPRDWTWDMDLEERWEACQHFMYAQIEELQAVLSMVKQQLPVARKNLQDATVRANAKVYENKTVIGGTIVGCIARLEAIRSTQPFAVIVEEASEVLEPLLFACLCPSTVKLQMIGDHLQLQPNLMDKFDFMHVNKVGVSMFERLIRAPEGHQVPNGVLSVQRRMRKDVCDLTREYYKDIVAIEDHEVCSTKVLPGNVAKRSFWNGREIPGLRSHIFLWTHDGAQSKAEVGLSKINRQEADMCVWLAYYLVSCGVQRSSIAMLTPYKGQLMLMRKLLLQDKSKQRLLSWDATEAEQVRLSTVDRFQGDEADVVIISLVVDENSRTPFVKLVNRMIVLLSRARLGMYILGNVGYFENRKGGGQDVKHWMRTFDLLKKAPEESDNNQSKVIDVDPKCVPADQHHSIKYVGVQSRRHLFGIDSDDDSTAAATASTKATFPLAQATFDEPRVGCTLPLCCPQHPFLSKKEATKAKDLELGFCQVSCEAELPCSHKCGMKCHWPQKQHNQNCQVLVESPCSKHPAKLACAHIFKHAKRASSGRDSVNTALASYECPEEVMVALPCTHERKMTCANEDAIAQGMQSYPDCHEQSPSPYIYPDCGHTLGVTCSQLAKYNSNHAAVKNCTKTVEYVPKDCDHVCEVKCYMAKQFTAGTSRFKCPKRVEVRLPRCGHDAKVSCAENVLLEKWRPAPGQERCAELGVVREQCLYGPKDHTCRIEVSYVRKCGHEQKVSCEEAFNLAAASQAGLGKPCTEKVNAQNPYCGHSCPIECSEVWKVKDIPISTGAPCNTLNEGEAQPFPTSLPRAMYKCKEKVTLHRRCGHTQQLDCALARSTLPKCSEMISIRSPLCGHEISVPCHLRDAIETWRPWGYDVEEGLQSENCLVRGAKPSNTLLPSAGVLECLKKCKGKTTVTKSCGHTYKESCAELTHIVSDGGEIKKGASCSETVVRQLRECGHEVTVMCKTWQKYTEGQADIKCKESVTKPCWNARHCGSNVLTVPCATSPSALLCCEKKSSWTCGSGKHKFELSLCLKGSPLTCPECDCESVEQELELLQSDDSSTKTLPHLMQDKRSSALGRLRNWFSSSASNASMAACFSKVSKEKVVELPVTEELKSKFWQAHGTNVSKFMNHRKNMFNDKFQQPQFEPVLIPVFFILSADKKQQREQENGFVKASAFVRGITLNGIALNRFTSKNVSALADETKGSTSKTLLCGFVYSVKAKDGCKWPSNGKEKTKFLKACQGEEGCDCVEFLHTKESQVTKLIVWAPFPLYATHRVGPLSAEELHALSREIKDEGAAGPSLQPRPVQFRKPAEEVVVGVAPSVAQAVGVESSAGGDGGRSGAGAEQTTIPALRDTWGESLQFPVLGGDTFGLQLRLVVGDEISDGMEKELLNKLSFINKDAPPFAGKKLLEKLMGSDGSEEGADKLHTRILLRILLSLEINAKDDAERAREELDKCCASLRKSSKSLAHPLLLLAFARLGCPKYSPGEPACDADTLLDAFSGLCPKLAELLFTQEEMAERQRRGVVESAKQIEDEATSSGAQAVPAAASAADLWADLKETSGCRSDAMEKLMSMTGLKKVKSAALQLFKMGLKFNAMDADTKKRNAPALNYVFLGNPGTGKTTVARLFAEILHDTGMRKKKHFEECGAQELKDQGPDEFKKKGSAAMDGVLFIDEAYNLDPVGDKFKGAPIANELLTLSENERERLTIILAGYEDELNDKLFAYNPGFKSRFVEVLFEDFDEDDLLKVWNHMREERKWTESDSRIGKVVVRRLAKLKGRKGFGNARDVRKKLEEACARAISREDFDPANLELEMEDAVGENPIYNDKLKKVIAEIDGKTGWAKVKQAIKDLVKLCGENYERELKGQPPLPVFLNRMFLGNPGTGKTTCAKLYGQVLKHLGFLSNGEVVEKTAGDLGGQVVGEAQQKTVALIEGCRGKVLLIDEAYGLDDNMYGKKALDVLVEKVQGTEADDIAVLLLGYEEQMLRMLDNQNPGLRRRFAPDQAFYFEDYSEQQLEQILLNVCKQNSWKPTLEFRERALKKLEMQKRSETHFGNAGAVNNLLKAALTKASAARSCAGDGLMRLEAEDVDLGPELEPGEDPFAALDKLYRMEHVKKKLQQLKATIDLAEEEGDERPNLGHFVFVGAPGTGKTTVARIMANMFFKSGLLSRDHVVETSGLNLTGEAVGQTKKKVEEQLDQAIGGVLFIDEAYELGKGSYGSEACSALVAAMTDSRYAGMAIVLAGYQADMQSMLDTNPGLKSRFNHFFEFPDWTAADCLDLFTKKAQGGNFAFEDHGNASKVLERGFSKLLPLKGWGNARDVTKLWEGVMQQRAERLSSGNEVKGKTLMNSDISTAMDSLVSARSGTVAAPNAHPNVDPFAPLDSLYRMDKVKQKLQQLKNTAELAAREGEEAPLLGHFVFSGAPGTGKTTVARVMADILSKLGLLGRNNVVETSGLELTGEYVGATKKKVEEQLDKAKGGVLFIDEAYELGKGQYGGEAVTTLVAAMTDPAYEGMAIIIAGYKADMDEMLNTNIGFKSRFKHFFEFPDWTPKDCFDLFCKKARSKSFDFDEEAISKVLLQGFKKLLPLKGWGNARDVTKFWETVMQNRADRVMKENGSVAANGRKEIALRDVQAAMDSMLSARLGSGESRAELGDDPFAPLDKLYRMNAVKEKLQQLRNTYVVAEADGEDAPPLGHFIFVGSPGTGKTTVARVMADILFELGLIGRRYVEETSGLDMTGQYVGQTKKVVEEKLEKAKGGVLFIDEAYNLGKGQFGSEACDTLVAALTNPQYAGLVVVIAGYHADINEMMDTNAGLKSRFNHTLEFPDWSPEDCVKCFANRAKDGEYALDADASSTLQRGFTKLVTLEGWGNARDVDAVWKAAKRARADRVVQQHLVEEKRLAVSDIQSAMDELIAGRQISHGKKSLRSVQPDLGSDAWPPALLRDPKPTLPAGFALNERSTDNAEAETEAEATEHAVATDVAFAERNSEDEPSSDDSGGASAPGVATRDAGVSDEVWAELQQAKEEEKRQEERLRAEEEERQRREAELEAAWQREQERLRAIAEEQARQEAARRAREAHEAKLRELQRQRELAEEQRREKQRIQEKLRRIGNCPAGFVWHKQGGGWRCGGGSHFVSDAELNKNYTY